MTVLPGMPPEPPPVRYELNFLDVLTSAEAWDILFEGVIRLWSIANQLEGRKNMQVDVTGRHVSLSTDQTAYAEQKAEKLGKFFDGINHVKITFEREGDDLEAEIICTVSGGRTLVAVEKGRTVKESLESASDNMTRQIKKHKDKLHHRRVQEPQRQEQPPRTEEQ